MALGIMPRFPGAPPLQFVTGKEEILVLPLRVQGDPGAYLASVTIDQIRNGTASPNIQQPGGNYTALPTDNSIIFNGPASGTVLTLPSSAATVDGHVLRVTVRDLAPGSTFTITPPAGNGFVALEENGWAPINGSYVMRGPPDGPSGTELVFVNSQTANAWSMINDGPPLTGYDSAFPAVELPLPGKVVLAGQVQQPSGNYGAKPTDDVLAFVAPGAGTVLTLPDSAATADGKVLRVTVRDLAAGSTFVIAPPFGTGIIALEQDGFAALGGSYIMTGPPDGPSGTELLFIHSKSAASWLMINQGPPLSGIDSLFPTVPLPLPGKIIGTGGVQSPGGNFTASPDDDTISFDTPPPGTVLTLPASSATRDGKVLRVKLRDLATGDIFTVAPPAGTDLIALEAHGFVALAGSYVIEGPVGTELELINLRSANAWVLVNDGPPLIGYDSTVPAVTVQLPGKIVPTAFTATELGMVPPPGTPVPPNAFLRADGQWQEPPAFAPIPAGTVLANFGPAPQLPAPATGSQITGILDIFTNTTKGLVPPSGGGATDFLRADGIWVDPGSSGGGGALNPIGPKTVLANLANTSAIPVGTGVNLLTLDLSLFTTFTRGVVAPPGPGAAERFLTADGDWEQVKARFFPTTQPATPQTGEAWYNAATTLEVWNGTSWLPVGLPLSGGTMTGAIVLAAAPTANMQAANKEYVDDEVATALPLSGGTMTGAIVLAAAPTANMEAANKEYVDEAIAAQALYQGTWEADTNDPDLTTTALQVNGYTWIAITPDPLQPFTITDVIPGLTNVEINNGDRITWSAAASEFQVVRGSTLSLAEAESMFVPFTGGTMTGALTLDADPTVNLGAATKQYVDTAGTALATVASGRDAYNAARLGGVLAANFGTGWMRGQLAAGTDLNDIVNPGQYGCFTFANTLTLLNRPPDITAANRALYLQVDKSLRYTDTPTGQYMLRQTATVIASNWLTVVSMWERTANAPDSITPPTWSAWKETVTDTSGLAYDSTRLGGFPVNRFPLQSRTAASGGNNYYIKLASLNLTTRPVSTGVARHIRLKVRLYRNNLGYNSEWLIAVTIPAQPIVPDYTLQGLATQLDVQSPQPTGSPSGGLPASARFGYIRNTTDNTLDFWCQGGTNFSTCTVNLDLNNADSEYVTLLPDGTAWTITAPNVAGAEITFWNNQIIATHRMFRPFDWTPNAETSFGDGLYGYRATGFITQIAGTNFQRVINLSNQVCEPVAHGGWFRPNAGAQSPHYANPWASSVANTTPGLIDGRGFFYSWGDTSGLVWNITLWTDCLRAPYDVWVLYRRAREPEGAQLPVPDNIEINGNILTWDAVSDAHSYAIRINGITRVTNNTTRTYTIPATWMTTQTHSVQVQAVARNNLVLDPADPLSETFRNSPWSTALLYGTGPNSYRSTSELANVQEWQALTVTRRTGVTGGTFEIRYNPFLRLMGFYLNGVNITGIGNGLPVADVSLPPGIVTRQLRPGIILQTGLGATSTRRAADLDINTAGVVSVYMIDDSVVGEGTPLPDGASLWGDAVIMAR